MKEVFIFCLGICLTACSKKEDRWVRIENFESAFVSPREIVVYLPPSYSTSTDSRYPVLYMHDGQMLFDSTTTWNGQEWQVDEVLDQLVAEKSIPETIVVGIANGGQLLRHSEYMPEKPFRTMTQETQDSILNLYRDMEIPLFGAPLQADNYLRFIVEEIKPYVDENFRTQSEQSKTFIGGSSMGGLISMYAVCEYPEVFGGAICLSTHWPGIFTEEGNPIPDALFSYLGKNLPGPENHTFYFDHGTATLDAMYEPYQKKADSLFLNAGYGEKNYLSKGFEGDPHTEKAWSRRLAIPLTFLLSNK